MSEHVQIESLIDARAGQGDAQSHLESCASCAGLSRQLAAERAFLRSALADVPRPRSRWLGALPFAAAAAVLATILVVVTGARERLVPRAPVATPPQVVVQEKLKKVRRDGVLEAIGWLARHQGSDGSWGAGHAACECFPRTKPLEPVARDPEIEKKARPYLAALAGDDPAVRDRATDALEALGRGVQPFVEDALKPADLDPELRVRLQDVLKRVRPVVTEPSLELTSMALLVFLGAGYSHLSKDAMDRICLGDVVTKALQWLISSQDAEGAFGPSPKVGVLPGQPIAALALAEAYGITGSALFRDPAQAGINHLVSRQHESGAWGAKGDELEPTLWAALVLKSAQISQLKFPGRAFESAVAWLEKNAAKGPTDAAAFAWIARMSRWGGDFTPHLEKVNAIDLAAADPFQRYVAVFAMFQNDSREAWDKRAQTLPKVFATPESKDPCERGAWGSGAAKARTTLLNALSLEVQYRYAIEKKE